jgi:PPOX class probable F420-dependent enzyme
MNEDGSPHVTCVWVGLEGDEIVCAHLPRHRKVENMERDLRVALSIEAEGVDSLGLKRYLVAYGRARITEGGAPELLGRLAATYLGPTVEFPPMPDPPPGYITHITVDRVAGVGPLGFQIPVRAPTHPRRRGVPSNALTLCRSRQRV